jgi:hypothetical protein
MTNAGFVGQKKAEEDATFCLIKDGTFFPLFCLTNPAYVTDMLFVFYALFLKVLLYVKTVINSKILLNSFDTNKIVVQKNSRIFMADIPKMKLTFSNYNSCGFVSF